MSYSEIIINGSPVKLIPLGDCACGCGHKTNISKQTDNTNGRIKGRPFKYICGHNSRLMVGKYHPNWQGGKLTNSNGYKMIWLPSHSRADSQGYVMEHTLIAENALNKKLPHNAVVHHHSRNQLVICNDQGYHMLIHQRQRAYNTSGNSNWRKCKYCKNYDDPKNLSIINGATYHNKCKAKYEYIRNSNHKSQLRKVEG